MKLDFETHYTLSRIPVTCKKCGKSGTIQTLMNCPIDLAVRVMKTLRCPMCQRRSTALRFLPGRSSGSEAHE